MKKNIIVLTGAGISAESGIRTFRDSNGLWEGHDVMEVASPQGWEANKQLVLNFYNERRKQARTTSPNQGHLSLVDLEEHFNVYIITQNVDNLHEKAGSSSILHLHGELFKSRSTSDPSLVYEMEVDELNIGDTCEKGSQLRPDIVWFGEDVPEFQRAALIAQSADVLLVVGTSLVVYPANTLIQYAPAGTEIYLVDPNKPSEDFGLSINYILEPASTGVPKVVEILKEKYLR